MPDELGESTPSQRYRFGPGQRLHGRRAFAAVFEARARVAVGPLLVCSRPNGLDHPRLGLSTPRRVGTAVRRNRIKRMVREAFRLSQHDWPGGYDLLVIIRPHEPLTLAEYQRLLAKAIRSVVGKWEGR